MQEREILKSGPSSAAHTKRQHVLASLSLALGGSLWGTGFLFGKIPMEEMTVAENVSFLFLTGAVALTPIVIRRWTA